MEKILESEGQKLFEPSLSIFPATLFLFRFFHVAPLFRVNPLSCFFLLPLSLSPRRLRFYRLYQEPTTPSCRISIIEFLAVVRRPPSFTPRATRGDMFCVRFIRERSHEERRSCACRRPTDLRGRLFLSRPLCFLPIFQTVNFRSKLHLFQSKISILYLYEAKISKFLFSVLFFFQICTNNEEEQSRHFVCGALSRRVYVAGEKCVFAFPPGRVPRFYFPGKTHPLPFHSANEKTWKLAPRFISLASYDYRFFSSSSLSFLLRFYSRCLSFLLCLSSSYLFSFFPPFDPIKFYERTVLPRV